MENWESNSFSNRDAHILTNEQPEFKLKPIQSEADWDNIRRWKTHLVSEIYKTREINKVSEINKISEIHKVSEIHNANEINHSDKVGIPQSKHLEISTPDLVNIIQILCQHYEQNTWHNSREDVIEEIRYRMKVQGFRNHHLVEEIGSKGYISDILNRRKSITLRTARIFHHFFDIPAHWLILDYPLNLRRESARKKSK